MGTYLLNFIALALVLSYVVAGDISTFKPFIRSRYSVRRRLTTSSAFVTELTTENPGEIKYKNNFNSYNLSQIPGVPITNVVIAKSDQQIIGQPQVVDTGSAITGEGVHIVHNMQTAHVTPQTKQMPAVVDFKGKTSTSSDYEYYDNEENDELEEKTIKV